MTLLTINGHDYTKNITVPSWAVSKLEVATTWTDGNSVTHRDVIRHRHGLIAPAEQPLMQGNLFRFPYNGRRFGGSLGGIGGDQIGGFPYARLRGFHRDAHFLYFNAGSFCLLDDIDAKTYRSLLIKFRIVQRHPCVKIVFVCLVRFFRCMLCAS